MYKYNAKIVRWVDGDTVIVDIDLGFYVTRQERIRLSRIDAPELNSKVAYQVRKAKGARAKAKKFAPEGSQVVLTTSKSSIDRYSRYIGEISFNGKNVSDYLIEMKVAKEVKY